MDEDTRQESLDHVGFLFAYIADKDIFHKYYSKLLSKRIIQLTSVSDEAEERMLKNMRKVSPHKILARTRLNWGTSAQLLARPRALKLDLCLKACLRA